MSESWGIVVGCITLTVATLFVGGHYSIEHRRRRLLRRLDQFHHGRDWPPRRH
jgi:hypothetical protein